MSRFVNEINDSPLAAERAEKDILGNKIDTTYQHKLTAGSNISINEVTNTISAQVPPDFSSVIPSDASSSNKLVTTNTLDARLSNFGGFKEVQGTGADLHPNVPSGEEDSKLIYLVRDNSATGDDKYKEWIWDSGDPEADPPVSAQWKLIGDTTMHLEGYVQKVQIDGTEVSATSGTVNIPLAVPTVNDGALSKEDKEKIDGYKYMYLSDGSSGEKMYANSPDLNLDVGFLSLGNYGYGRVPGFVAVGREGQEECFFGNQGSNPAFGIYDNQSQQFTVKELVTTDSYVLDGKADKAYGATSGNLAALDDDGNLMDSGKNPTDLQSIYQSLRVQPVTGNLKIEMQDPSRRNDVKLEKNDGTSTGALGSLVPNTGISQGRALICGGTGGTEWSDNINTNFAPLFSSNSTYGVNDRVVFGAKLYRCIDPVTTPSFFNLDNWTTASIDEEITDLENRKADKVYGATSGNLAALDSSGNLFDSGVDPSQLSGNLKQGLQGLQGTQIQANSDLNTYTAPGNYYIASAANMVTISNTPFEQMGFSSSETAKTGQSQVTVYNLTGTASGRVMQVMYTIYSTNPGNDNAFGFWFRMSDGGSSQTWGTWKRLGEQDNRFWCGYKNSANYLLITVKHIPNGTAGDSILMSFTGNQYGVMLKLCFGMASEGGFNSATPTLHVIEANNLLAAGYNPLYTSGGGVAKYYYDSTNKLYYFLLKTTTTNRMMCTVESVNPRNYSFSTPSTAPSWLSSASNIATGHALPHITDSRVGNSIGSSTQPVYVSEYGSIEPCSVSDSRYFAGNSVWPSATAYAYVKAGITVTVTVDSMLENKTYTAQVVRTGSDSSQFNIKFQSDSVFNVYGHSQTTTNVTTYTLVHSIYPMLFMRSGRNIYIIWY